MRDIVLAAVVFGWLLMVFKHPHYGIYLWSWLSYMNPHKQTWGFAHDMPFALMTAGVTIAAYLFSKETKRIVWAPEIVVLLIFNLWMIVTTQFAFYPDAAGEQWSKVWKIQLMTLVTVMLITDRRRIEGLVWVIALSLGFYGVKGGIFTISTGGNYRVWGPEGTFIGGNNEIALALIMVVPLMRYLQLQATRKFEKFGLVAAMLLSSLAAIGSQSRGALLAIAAMGMFLWLKSRQKLVTAIYALAVIVAVLILMPQSWYERMDTIESYQEDASAIGRINAWHTAFNVAIHRLTGGGFELWGPEVFASYAPDPLNVRDVHSVYFEILGEHGFIGLALWLLAGLLAWNRANRVIKSCRSDAVNKWAADLAAMVQVSMVGYAVGGAFLGLAYFDLYYHLIALILLTYQASRMEVDPTGARGNRSGRIAALPHRSVPRTNGGRDHASHPAEAARLAR